MIGLAGALLAYASTAYAATALTFQPPALSPTSQSSNYTGASNNTITNGPVVPGKSFDRIIQIWFENTDYETAITNPTFANLTSQGLLLTSYYAVTHPSEPNYIAAAGGDFFGNAADDFRAIPSNISTIVDILEAKNISWSSYQESMPYDGCMSYNYTSYDYVSGTGNYTYYVRKHNPLIIFDSVSNVSERALRIRNFNDFANDINHGPLSQWTFITPNLVNDGHDTTITYMANWTEYWLLPLLRNPNFNDNRTLIFVTFDETETYTINNRIYALALGGALPANLVNTTDDAFYTHYSAISTVQANWDLQSLGRQDANKTVNNVFSWVAATANWTNNGLIANSSNIPLLNLTGTIAGPLNPELYLPFTAPDASAMGPGAPGVFVSPGTNTSFTTSDLPAPVNLTNLGQPLPWSASPGYDYVNGSKAPANVSTGASPSPSPSSSGAERVFVPVLGAVVAAVGAMVML
ncbi:phosphoesterase family-domain-containing protein [Sparassis latifolia]|uniref:Acid phosphatase n=1 Tax=Sparassis crispa TaxID=139825 RepID=A0A401GNZ7_9APHY|nr:Acid phosphatase [Sparassis crispa]GBE83474.1 Acid phosphatase [Sparassis crispa]